MALVSKAFGDIITFTRASTATYFDSAGVLTSAATNAPRFDYNPSTLAAQGLLIEEARTNLLTYSSQFDDAIWAKLNVTVTANTGTSPDGTLSADLVLPDATVGQHRIRQDSSITNGTAYSNSIYFKASGYDWVYIQLSTGFDGAGALYRNVNIANGTLGSGTLGANDVTVTPISNGWYRVNITRTATLTATGRINWLIQNADAATASFAGDGVSGVLAWGAQLEAGAFPTSYIPTTTTALTRAADVASVNTLSPWFNATTGTVFGEWNSFANSTVRYVVDIEQAASSNDRIDININTSNVVNPRTVVGGAAIASLSGGTYTVNTNAKVAFAYASADYASSLNGASAVTATTVGALPSSLARMFIGSLAGATQINGHLRRVVFYPRRLSNAELVSITS